MKTIGALLLLALSAAALAQEAEDLVEIQVFRTPVAQGMFRPDLPAESITLKWNGADEALLIVRINVPRALILQYTEREMRVEPHVFLDAAKIAADQKLVQWEPKGQKTSAEYGETGYEVSWHGRVHRKTWGGKITNEAGPMKLARHMAQLARDRMDLPIEFIGRD